MKTLKHIRRSALLHIHAADIHGGIGSVTIGDWTGSVVWGTDEDGWEHVSVSPYDKSITPSWDDMCKLKDIFWGDEEMAIQIHPKKSQYVNMVENCLHLWAPKDARLREMLEGITK